MKLDAPADDQIEISLFGRGYGEAILLHLGAGNWVMIDSLADKNSAPEPVIYLKSIGVDPSKIRLIVATHWHDDHVKGISKAYELAPQSVFVLPGAMGSDEWRAFHEKAVKGGSGRVTSGVQELENVAKIKTKEPHRPPMIAAKLNTVVLRLLGANSGHGFDVDVETLAPSNKDILEFYSRLAAFDYADRVEPFARNDVSLAIWVKIGDERVLLGADLEVVGDDYRGWKAVLSSSAPLSGKASYVKIPHHGSSNGHHEPFWIQHVESQPVAALSPWNRGTKLPTAGDRARILGKTDHAYTSSSFDGRKPKRPQTVEKTLQRCGVKLEARPQTAGIVRARKRIGVEKSWSIELLNAAMHLSEL